MAQRKDDGKDQKKGYDDRWEIIDEMRESEGAASCQLVPAFHIVGLQNH
jgi:hypothetical protein